MFSPWIIDEKQYSKKHYYYYNSLQITWCYVAFLKVNILLFEKGIEQLKRDN